jgi:UDP-glucose 4-epimerase
VRALARNTNWLQSLMPNADLAVHQWDLNQVADSRILAGVDVVCHLAAYVPPDQDDPKYAQACLLSNAVATQHLLEGSRQSAVSHFIYFSGGNSYSRQERLVNEADAVFPSRHAVYYLGSKLVGELFCEHSRLAHAQRTTTLRLSSVYGPGQVTGVVVEFARSLIGGQPVDLDDGGRHTVDLVFVEDVVRAAWRVIERGVGGIYNIGSGERHSLAEVAQIVAELTGAGSELLRTRPSNTAGTTGFCALDISKARAELGYEPTPLPVGLEKCVEWLKTPAMS